MARNIEEFISKLNEVNSLISSSKFEITVIPKSNILANLNPNKFMRFLAFSADIPGISLTPDLIFLNGHGRVNEIPIRTNISDCEIQFYMDNNNNTYRYFYNWMNIVSNFDGINYESSFSRNNEKYGFDEMSYASEYYSEIYIRVLKDDGTTQFITHLIDAYPMELSGINMDWNNTNIITSAQIRIGFRAMKNSLVLSNDIEQPFSP